MTLIHHKSIKLTHKIILFKNFFNIFIYFWEIQTECERGRGRDTEPKAVSRLQAVSTEPDGGLKLTNRELVTQAEVRRLPNWATQAPRLFYFKQQNTKH